MVVSVLENSANMSGPSRQTLYIIMMCLQLLVLLLLLLLLILQVFVVVRTAHSVEVSSFRRV